MTALILYSIPFFFIAIVAFFLTTKWSMSIRVMIAGAIWLIPPIVLTLWVLYIGDQPPPDAKTVDPQTMSVTPKETGDKKDK